MHTWSSSPNIGATHCQNPQYCDLSRIFAKVCKDFEADLIECNGEDDHVSLIDRLPGEGGALEIGQ